MSKLRSSVVVSLAILAAFIGLIAQAAVDTSAAASTLVARWDFNNYNPANPTSTDILVDTVSGACAVPAENKDNGKNSTPITDGTIGAMYVVSPDYAGADSEVTTCANTLETGNYALAIPRYKHLRLPIPDALKTSLCWTMRVRLWSPMASDYTYRCIFNKKENDDDGDLFIRSSDNKVGINRYDGTSLTSGAWHTIVINAGPNRSDVFLDGEEVKYWNDSHFSAFMKNNSDYFVFCGDDNGEDNTLYIDYVELYADGGAAEAKLPVQSKSGMVGEWRFSGTGYERLKATVGNDLEKYTRSGGESFDFSGADGVLPGDGYVRAGQNNGFKCYHNLPKNSSYTVVMDVRVPVVKSGEWYALFQPLAQNNGDGRYYLSPDGDGLKLWVASSKYTRRVAKEGEWIRVAFTYENGGNKIIYVNGAKIDTRGDGNMMITDDHFYFLVENSGEDHTTDLSYVAIYDRVLTDNEIADLHSRCTAHDADGNLFLGDAPAGLWLNEGGNWNAVKGQPLEVQENGLVWTRVEAAPAEATYIMDVTLPETQTAGGALVMNENNVASGVYGTSSQFNGSFATTKNPAGFANNSQFSEWGYWTYNTLERGVPHRVAVTWSKSGTVLYYVDGRIWCQLFPTYANTAATPTGTMRFLTDSGASATMITAYDRALTPEEVARIGTAGQPTDPKAAPAVTFAVDKTEAKAFDVFTFTISGTSTDNELVSYQIDYGDGVVETTSDWEPMSSKTFTHAYSDAGTFTVKVRVYTYSGAMNEAELEVTAQMNVMAVWTGEASDGKWSTDGNWSSGAPKDCDSVAFDSEATESVNDFDALKLNHVLFGVNAGAFDLGGSGLLTVLFTVSNLAANVQSFAMPVVGGDTFADLYATADGGLAFNGGFTGDIPMLRKTGAGAVTIKGRTPQCPLDLAEGSLLLSDLEPSYLTNPFSAARDELHLNGLIDLGGASQTLSGTSGSWLSDGEKIAVTNGTLTITTSSSYSDFFGDLVALKGGTINHNARLRLIKRNGTVRILADGGTVNHTGSGGAYIGSDNYGSTGVVEVVNGGRFYAPRTFTFGGWENIGTVGKLLISSGGTADFDTANVAFGINTGATGVLHVENGTLRVGSLTTPSSGGIIDAIFDAATVIATAARDPFISTALAESPFRILSGGLTLDNSGYDIGIAATFCGEGGVTLAGAGRTTFSKPQSFAGDLTVGSGTMLALKGGANVFSGDVIFAAGSRLDLENTEDGIATLTARSVDLSELTAEQPLVLTITSSAALEVGVKYRVFATQEGTVTEEDLAKIALPPLMVGDLADGVFSIRLTKMAVWTGAGDVSNPFDPANWQDGEVPDENAYVLLSSPVSFTLPLEAQLPIAGFFTASTTLELGADCDWRAMGDRWMTDLEGVTIDLKGHDLHLAAPNGTYSGSLTITDTTSEDPGDLHMEVADGETFTNSGLTLAGNVRLVKDGAGTFVANRNNQPYRRGNEVCAGTLRCAVNPDNWVMGGNGIVGTSAATNVVHAGATFDVNQKVYWGHNTFVLDGGTLTGVAGNHYVNAYVILTRDSVWEATGNGGVESDVFDLGGHALAFGFANGSGGTFNFQCVPVNGTIRCGDGNWLGFNKDFESPNLDLDIGKALKVTASITVRNYASSYAYDYNEGDAIIKVLGAFTPKTAYFHGVELQDGATLDLSEQTGVFDVTSSFTSGAKTCTFADGATIGVKLGAKKCGKIVAWTTRPDASVKFVTAGEPGCKFVVKDDGLYVRRGLVMVFR